MTPMIFRFAIDPEALVCARNDGPIDVAVRAAHERIIDCWRDFGILVLENPDAEGLTLRQVVENLPEALQKLWEKPLKRYPVLHGGPNWIGLGNVSQLDDLAHVSNYIDLACFDQKKASTVLGMGLDQWSFFYRPKLEVCRFDYLDRSETFLQSKELAHDSIEKGASVETVWKRRFATLARLSRNVSLIDRYALSAHWYCQRKGITSGLEFLVEKLGTRSRPHDLTVITATNGDYSQEFASRILKQLVSRPRYKALKEVTLFIAEDTAFTNLVHYRSIRFGRVFCQLDTGLEVLAGPRVIRTCNFHVMAQTSVLDREEAIIKKSAEMDVVCRRREKE